MEIQLNVGKNIHRMKIERSAFKMKMKNERNGTCGRAYITQKLKIFSFLHCKKTKVSCRIPACGLQYAGYLYLYIVDTTVSTNKSRLFALCSLCSVLCALCARYSTLHSIHLTPTEERRRERSAIRCPYSNYIECL